MADEQFVNGITITQLILSCYQVLLDVLWVRQLSLCVAVTAQDAKLETTIQVLPLVRRADCRANAVQCRKVNDYLKRQNHLSVN